MRDHLRAGAAIFNAGHHHAAHDAWEDYWLDLEPGPDRDFLQGLIQYTAAIYHARRRNWTGATGLAESAGDYLAPLALDHRESNVGPVREYLAVLARDPEVIERRDPPALTHEGTALALDDLDFDAAATAAGVLAEDLGYDEAVIDRGVEYARRDLDDGRASSPFVTLVMDFARDAENRALVFTRLSEHVDRRRHRQRDVEGLFD